MEEKPPLTQEQLVKLWDEVKDNKPPEEIMFTDLFNLVEQEKKQAVKDFVRQLKLDEHGKVTEQEIEDTVNRYFDRLVEEQTKDDVVE